MDPVNGGDMAPIAKGAPDQSEHRTFHDRRMVEADFDLSPFTIAWEITRACAYACVHCRADAQHRRDPPSSRPRRPRPSSTGSRPSEAPSWSSRAGIR